VFISHSSKDELAAEALRIHLADRGWNRKEIFLDFDIEGISAHEEWKTSLAKANAGANACICLASPDWLASVESQVERRVAETFRDLDRQGSRAVLVAILRDLELNDLRAKGFGDDQIVDLSAAGKSTLIRAELPGRPGRPGRHDDIKFNTQALEKIERSLRRIGVAPGTFEWRPRDPARLNPYPGLEAFTENEAGIFFGRESRMADALGIINDLVRDSDSRVLTIIAASGAGKSSFLRAGLWPRLARQSGVAPLAVLRPGAGIISGREGGLIHALADWFQRAGQMVSAGDLRNRLADRSTREGLSLMLTEAARAAGKGRALIIAIDQAEELFDTTDQTSAKEAKEFLDALLALLATPLASVELLVIFAIRSDSYDPLAAALRDASNAAEKLGAPRCRALQETSLTLQPLSATAYRDVIRRPAQIALKTDSEIFEPALVEELVSTFAGADALPLLAMTVEQLFADYGPRQRITLADYRTLYGTGGPVIQALNKAYRVAGGVGTDEALKRLLIPELVTWDPNAGEGGVARRRIALRRKLLDDQPDLTALADALVSPQVRLLTRGRAEVGPTLEVAHESLLRVQPVKSWVEEFSAELRLRDDIEREAKEWQLAEARLAAGRAERPEQLEALQKDVGAAIAARRGPRLEAAVRLTRNSVFARLLGQLERTYVEVCLAHETKQRDNQRRIIVRAFVKPAAQALAEGLNDHALRLTATGALLADDLDLKLVRELWGSAARAILQSKTRAVLEGHAGPVVASAFSPDGKRVLTASDTTARLWDAETGSAVAVLKTHTDAVSTAAFSPDGRRVVTASADNTACLWDAETGTYLAVLKGHQGAVKSAAFSPDGQRVVTASEDKTARLWDAHKGTEIAVLKAHTSWVLDAAFSPDGKRVVTASADNTARLWDAETRAEIAVLKGHLGAVQSAAFSPDGGRVVTVSSDQTARLWDVDTRSEIPVLKGDEGSVSSAAFSPDGKRVVIACEDKTVRLWHAKTGKEIVLKGHTSSVRSAAFSPDGKRVVTASADATARLWDAETGAEIAALNGHEGEVRSAAFSPDGRRVVTASEDTTARLWDAAARTEIAALKGHEAAMRSAAFSYDGKRVVTASADATARLWDAETGAEIAALNGHEDALRSAAFSPDGRRVVTASEDTTARLWNAATGSDIAVLKGHEGAVRSAEFSPDGKRVVTASEDKTARLWNAETGTKIAPLKGHEGAVGSAAFGPDSRRVVTASEDKTARLWDAETGSEIGVLKGHEGAVWSAAFSPDGRRVVTTSEDNTARLWDAETRTEIIALNARVEPLFGKQIGALFSTQGKEIMIPSEDGTMRVLDAETGTELSVYAFKPVLKAVFDPDSRRLVIAPGDSNARLWDADTHTEIAVLKGHTSSVQGVAFSRDGRRVVTASDDNTARLWDAETGTEIAVLKGHKAAVKTAEFSPNGRRLVTASEDYTVRLWDVSRSEVIVRDRAVVLTAALAQGVGSRTANERLDLLMQDAPEDLFSTARDCLGDRARSLAETVAALSAPLHPNCYLSPTEFAAKFARTPSEDLG
jgi:WD40 repeat protein